MAVKNFGGRQKIANKLYLHVLRAIDEDALMNLKDKEQSVIPKSTNDLSFMLRGSKKTGNSLTFLDTPAPHPLS